MMIANQKDSLSITTISTKITTLLTRGLKQYQVLDKVTVHCGQHPLAMNKYSHTSSDL